MVNLRKDKNTENRVYIEAQCKGYSNTSSFYIESKSLLVVILVIITTIVLLGSKAIIDSVDIENVTWCTLNISNSTFEIVDKHESLIDETSKTYQIYAIIKNIETNEVGDIKLENNDSENIDNYKTLSNVNKGDYIQINDKVIEVVNTDS